MTHPVENFDGTEVFRAGPNELSSKSSIRRSHDAQVKHRQACIKLRFPHFHSDGYYYGLYTSVKTG